MAETIGEQAARIFGIVKQSGGNIWVYGEPNEGTTFRIYFPKAGEVEEPVVETPPTPVLTGSETILLAEDQDDVRSVASESLRRYGYPRARGEEWRRSVAHLRATPASHSAAPHGRGDAEMNGRELALRLRELRPDLRILYMSGYPDNAIVHHGILEPDVAYVQKPMVPETLARRVREVLDSPRRTHPPRA